MANLDSDDDLRRAIQLSLQCDLPEVGPRLQRTQEIVNLDSEDESTTDESADEQATVYREQPKAALPPSSMGILGLDRKAMEQERLARKRKASISPPPVRKVARLSGSLPKTLSRDHHRSENRPPARQSVTPATVGEPLANFANTVGHDSSGFIRNLTCAKALTGLNFHQ